MNEKLCIVQKYAFDENLELDGLIMKLINADEKRPNGHAINHLYKESIGFGRVCAGKCNCSQIHQIFENEVIWDSYIPADKIVLLLSKKDFERSLLTLIV
jgi:hypothetical protein